MRAIDADDVITRICKRLGIKDTEYLLPAEKAIVDVICEAPTIELPTWIPCAEKLPSEETDVLVTVCGHTVHQAVYGEPEAPQNENGVRGIGFYESDDYGDYYIGGVIAWQPLPQPYREGE